MIDQRDFERIREEVQETMAHSMEMFDFEDVINNTDDLTPEEKEWAMKNLDWSVNLVALKPCKDTKKPRYYEHVGTITYVRP